MIAPHVKKQREDEYLKAVNVIVRRLLAYFPQLENYPDELLSAAGEGVCSANLDYDPHHKCGKSRLNWLIWAGEKKAFNALSSAKCRLIGQHKRKSSLARTINESDLLYNYPHLTLDYLPDKREWRQAKEREYEEEKRSFLAIALGLLSKFERKIFTEFYIEGLSYKQICAKYRVEEKQIDNSLIRGKRKIKNFLKRHPEWYPSVSRGVKNI